ncbi:MAG: hypothetical protein E7446_07105 [Ruminococcaceae bacterium]|nr:hypothetical protein [Oscillospiraceae bacterium]
MYPYKKTKIYFSPWTALLLAAFIYFASPELLAALLFAALAHELGHYAMLRKMNVAVTQIHISPFGAKISTDDRKRLSYGGEILTVLAGPISNLALALLLGYMGSYSEVAYLFAGAQLVLGLFNLLPIHPLDGSRFLWLLTAWCTEPFTADRISFKIHLFTTTILLLVAILLLYIEKGSPFLLLGIAGPLWYGWEQKRLVKPRGNR